MPFNFMNVRSAIFVILLVCPEKKNMEVEKVNVIMVINDMNLAKNEELNCRTLYHWGCLETGLSAYKYEYLGIELL
jgi:hypothetical protein